MRLPRSLPAPSRCPRKWSRSMPPIIACWRATSRRGGRSRRRRCRRWTAMRCARPMPPISRARLKVIGEVAAGRPFERKVGAGEAVRIFTGGVIPDGADAVIIQEDTGRRRRPHHHHGSRRDGAAYPPRRRRFPRGRRAARARTPPHRPRSVARRRHELSGACRCAAARRSRCSRTGDELVMPGIDPRPRPDRLFQRLRAAGAGARRGRRDHRSRHRRRHGRRHRAKASAARASSAPIS